MSFKEYRAKLHEDAEGIPSGETPTNTTNPDEFATYATPLFTQKRFAGMKEFVIPRDQYGKMRFGRDLGSRWLAYVEDAELQAAIRKAYHDDESLLLTCAETNISCIIRKIRNRQRKHQEVSLTPESGV
jgi:hypothetical protein